METKLYVLRRTLGVSLGRVIANRIHKSVVTGRFNLDAIVVQERLPALHGTPLISRLLALVRHGFIVMEFCRPTFKYGYRVSGSVGWHAKRSSEIYANLYRASA